MRIMHIRGPAGSGKTHTLNILAKDAGCKVTDGNTFCEMIRMHENGVIKLTLQLATFIDEVTVKQAAMIDKFAKGNYPSHDYVIVMVDAA